MTERAELPLPVASAFRDLRAALAERRGAVLVAPPGTGKTTGVPPALLEEPWLLGRRILVLEPRRVAARAAAARMASNHGEPVGRTFGYVVRHDRRAGRDTRVLVMTEGVLERRLRSDPLLEGVGLVVLDELHERSVELDLATALLLDVQAGVRDDLRLLAMSATLETAAAARLLGADGPPAPVIVVESPLHEVRTVWRPGDARRSLERRVAATVREAWRDSSGDILVFLPGRPEIAAVRRELRRHPMPDGVTVMELHSSIPTSEQDRVLAGGDGTGRRLILSTSMAETSVTVPGVRVVVDAGRRRTVAVDPRSGLPALVTGPVSRAGADQRRGRAGREGPGVCYRLWSETDHRHRDDHDTPAILTGDLADLVLRTADWGVDAPARLRWMDPPPSSSVQRATTLLSELGAVEATGRITERGRKIVRLGLSPRLGAIVATGEATDQVDLALEVAAVIETGGPGGEELAERVRALRSGTAGDETRRVLGQLRRRARPGREGRTHAAPGGEEDPGLDAAVGRLALAGYADRLAMRRRDRGGVYLMRHGGEVRVDSRSPLARSEWLVVIDLDAATGSGRPGRIHMAAPLGRSDVGELVASEGEEVRELRWEDGRLLGTRSTRLGAITVSTRPWHAPEPQAVTEALRTRVATEGPEVLPRWPEADQLRARVAFAAEHDLPLPSGATWPDLSPEGLRDVAEGWVREPASRSGGPRDLADVDVVSELRSALGWEVARALETEAPERWVSPGGVGFPLRYGAVDGDPASVLLSTRLQRMLGIDVHPRVSSREVPVVVELLSPADRPVQRTTDLPGFWRGSYAQVRREMRSRYRKHAWPEDPLQVQPLRTRRP